MRPAPDVCHTGFSGMIDMRSFLGPAPSAGDLCGRTVLSRKDAPTRLMHDGRPIRIAWNFRQTIK